jgi:hypothetical protein
VVAVAVERVRWIGIKGRGGGEEGGWIYCGETRGIQWKK